MALSQKLEIRQSQALVMTPQLMQAIKLLQLSNLDLSAYVEGELERNPLLERPSEGPGGANWRPAPSARGAMGDSSDPGIENLSRAPAGAPPPPAQAEPAAYSE